MAATNENLFQRIGHTCLLSDMFLLGVVLAGITGCLKSSGPEVIVYTALDREFSEPILKEFENLTGIHVRAKYDVESTKTVGLTTEIIAESKKRTRCDLFWNNEIVNTIRIDNLNLLDVKEFLLGQVCCCCCRCAVRARMLNCASTAAQGKEEGDGSICRGAGRDAGGK